MSRQLKLGKSQAGSKLNAAVQQLDTLIKQQGANFASAQATQQLISLESLSDSAISELNVNANHVNEEIIAAMQSVGLEGLTDAQIQAATITALAAGNPRGYAEKAMAAGSSVSVEGMTVFDALSTGAAGVVAGAGVYSPESFNELELRNHLATSIVFNMQAARQDEFNESFFGTVVLDPSVAGLDMEVVRTMVQQDVTHPISGKVIDWKLKNLVDATRDSTILSNEALKVVPVRQVDDSNAQYFVDETVIAPTQRRVADIDFQTAPLKVGVELDLLGISQLPGLLGSNTDSTDELAPHVAMQSLYIKLTNGTDTEIFKFNVSRLPRNSFVKTVEGNGKTMGLQFVTTDLTINKDTKQLNGANSVLLAAVATGSLTLRLSLDAFGEVNLERGRVKVSTSSVGLVGILDVDGNEVGLTAGAGAALAALISTGASAIGYDLDAARSNADLRSRGTLLNQQREVERYTVDLQAPITIPVPVASQRDGSDLAGLITAARTRNNNVGITTLLNYAETLKAYIGKGAAKGELNVEGVGRHLVTPYFEEIELDVSTVVDSIKSHERADDVSAAIVNTIRDAAYRMNRDSNYSKALEAFNGGVEEQPRLVIGTDSVIARHLMVSGDARTMGITFDHKIVTTNDTRMADTIVLAFSRESNGAADPFSFGNFAWMPELTSTVQVARRGANLRETFVQPRCRHVNNLPVMVVIKVTKLKEALTQ